MTPGDYYIKVADSAYKDGKYELILLFEEEDDSYESEPNDELNSQAMVINLDKEYKGNLTTSNDLDYFKFTLNEKRKVWLDFSHDKTSESSTYWEVSLFDDTDGSLLEIYSKGENAKMASDQVRLPAGNYYIRIKSGSYWSDMDYTFCVHSEQEGAETENEDNGDYNRATPITIGSSMVGNIQSRDDVDFYKFDLTDTASVTVLFEHARTDKGDTFWIFELHSVVSSDAIKNREEDMQIRISGDSSERISSTWDALPAGTYYLKVDKSSYCNEDYKITVSY